MPNVSTLPTLSSWLFQLMSLVGVPVTIIGIVQLALWATSWMQSARKVAHTARQAHEIIVRGAEGLGATRPAKIILAAIVTISVTLSQLFLVGLCYLAGNYLSLAFDPVRAHKVQSIVDEYRFDVLKPNIAAKALQLNYVSGTFLLVCVATIFVSYKRALRGLPLDETAAILRLPGTTFLDLGTGWADGSSVVAW